MLRSSCKQANPELAAMWAVGQRIWQRDFPGVYTAIAAFQWSENILPVMESLRGTPSTTDCQYTQTTPRLTKVLAFTAITPYKKIY
jgi:hypothetical protein